MSFYRANVQWECADGTWGMGFYAVVDEDLNEHADSEWNVEYDYSTFESVTTGHPDPESAWRTLVDGQGRPNPGSSRVYRRAQFPQACAEFDAMAEACPGRSRYAEREPAEPSAGEASPAVVRYAFTVRFAWAGDRLQVSALPYPVELTDCVRRGEAGWDPTDQVVFRPMAATSVGQAVDAALADPDVNDLIGTYLLPATGE